MKGKVAQSCLTLCDPLDCSPPGSSVHGILQARTLEWVAVPFSRGSSQPRDRTQISRVAGGFFTAERILYQLSYEGSPLSLIFLLDIFAPRSFSVPLLPSGLAPDLSRVRPGLLLRRPLPAAATLDASLPTEPARQEGKQRSATRLPLSCLVALSTSRSFGLYPFLFLSRFIEAELVYNVVFIASVRQHDSVTHIHIHAFLHFLIVAKVT